MRDYRDISLLGRNSFGLACRAARLVEFESAEELHGLWRDGFFAEQGGWTALGGGNNMLFVNDFDGALLHPAGKRITVLSETSASLRVRVEAGVEWDDFVAWTVGRGLWGAENLSLIPGSAGAAPVQNIGAYGAEVKDIILSVELFLVENGQTLALAREQCGFGYRDSVFKRALRGRAVITAVNFELGREPQPNVRYGDMEQEVKRLGGATLQNVREAVVAIRRRKLPDPAELGNAGSFFKNPVASAQTAERLRAEYPDMPEYPAAEGVKLAAAWLIERAGWKGFRRGAVGVHVGQPLVLVNYGGATGREIVQLAEDIRSDVEARFGVRLETEVNIIC
ncbi:MAG: UDP-N-acetylmuramate dehydrogenase [Rikenellaceae bacterium]|jgi:UDP-N-acetylmuramate dehydrogenase|nr:UDP-N-acetylmuramate dehydrogenase [Rikenellaceae bacterium]